MRKSPNVIITGTPGVGKTVHCEQLAQETGLRHLSINQVAKDRECYDGYDEERKSWIVDEDKVWNIHGRLCRRRLRYPAKSLVARTWIISCFGWMI